MRTEQEIAEHEAAKYHPAKTVAKIGVGPSTEKYAELLAKSGFTTLSYEFCERMSRRARLAIAQEHYPVIHGVKLRAFAARLKADTLQSISSRRIAYQAVVLDPLGSFAGEAPPPAALLKLDQARESKVFDSFKVASIQWQHETLPPPPDPILLGIIDGCEDYFVIAQWGHDVTAEEIEGV